MTYIVDGAKTWRPELIEGDAEWQLRYRCPTCGRSSTVLLQPLPWSVPAAENLTPAGELNEQRRRAGTIRHVQETEPTTQLWCHLDGKGISVTIRQE